MRNYKLYIIYPNVKLYSDTMFNILIDRKLKVYDKILAVDESALSHSL